MQPPAARPLNAVVAATLGIALYTVMDVLMKGATLVTGAYVAVLARAVFGFALSAGLFVATRQRWPVPAVIRLHAWRASIISAMAFLWFWGIARLPLAEAIGLSFIAPVIALVLAALILKERVRRGAVAAALLGTIGVAVILWGRLALHYRPGAAWGAGAILGSAVLYAYNLVLARQQAQVAGPLEIAFFNYGFSLAIFALFAPWLAAVPPLAILPSLAGAALLATFSLILLSWAYARAEAQVLIPVEYTAFGWAAVLGWLVFGEALTAPTVLGTMLIAAGSVMAARAAPELEGPEEIGG